MWPTRSLGILTEIKDPAACRTGPRQYLAYPLWQNQSPTGVVRRDKIVLTGDRTKRRSTVRLRAADRPTTRKNEVTLQMLVTGLGAQDHLQLALNNHAIAESQLQKMELQGRGSNASRLHLIPICCVSVTMRSQRP